MKIAHRTHKEKSEKPHAVAAALVCASLTASLVPAVALASQTNILEVITTKNVASIAEGTLSANSQVRWALGANGNLALAGAGAICADDGIYDICDQVEHVFVGKDITSIEPEAFCFFSQLKTIEFEGESKLSSIGSYAFAGCQSLEYIDLPASVRAVGAAAFSDCSKLSWASFGAGNSALDTIGASAFANCKSLNALELPDSLKTVGDYAFNGCEALTSVTIPPKVKTIGEGAFENCPQLKDVKIENPSTTRVDGYAFSGTTKANISTVTVKKIKAAKKSLRISWSKVSKASSYKLYYKQASASKWKSIQTKRASKTIKRLKKGRYYQLYVAALENGKVVCKSAIKTSSKVK